MSDLTAFLLARIAEDETCAYHALGLLGIETDWHKVAVLRERGLTRADATHVNRWSPRSVLAECEAKRRIVETLDRHDALLWAHENTGDLDSHSIDPGAVLVLLTLPYDDHPDYDEGWRL